MCIFLVEDDLDKQREIQLAVSELGKKVVVTKDYDEASDELERVEPSVFILSDTKKHEVVKAFLKEKVPEHAVTIVLISPESNDDEITDLIYSGASWVLQQPISLTQIRAYVWRAAKISSGVRLMKKAGTLSLKVRDKMRESLQELRAMSTLQKGVG